MKNSAMKYQMNRLCYVVLIKTESSSLNMHGCRREVVSGVVAQQAVCVCCMLG